MINLCDFCCLLFSLQILILHLISPSHSRAPFPMNPSTGQEFRVRQGVVGMRQSFPSANYWGESLATNTLLFGGYCHDWRKKKSEVLSGSVVYSLLRHYSLSFNLKCHRLNLGPFACKVNGLSLSHTPSTQAAAGYILNTFIYKYCCEVQAWSDVAHLAVIQMYLKRTPGLFTWK